MFCCLENPIVSYASSFLDPLVVFNWHYLFKWNILVPRNLKLIVCKEKLWLQEFCRFMHVFVVLLLSFINSRTSRLLNESYNYLLDVLLSCIYVLPFLRRFFCRRLLNFSSLAVFYFSLQWVRWLFNGQFTFTDVLPFLRRFFGRRIVIFFVFSSLFNFVLC